MIQWEQTMEIKILRRQGKSLRRIAHEVGMAVNTVRKYLQHEGRPFYKKRKKVETKLDPYKPYLQERVKQARPFCLPATVLLREIRDQGYRGGVTQLRLYLNSLTPVVCEEVVRFETEPGAQMQMDWIEFRKGKNPLSAFVATLGYSRVSYVCFVENEKLSTLLQCHEDAFDYFGGIPSQALYDNMKTVILARDAYGLGKHRFNSGMLDFAKHHGFQLKVCRPYRAKTKGKVERFNRYLRYSFYNPLASRLKSAGLTLDVQTANMEVLKWLKETANQRVHGTTKEIPLERLERERSTLQPLGLPYRGDVSLARCVKEPEIKAPEWAPHNPLQHPLSVYDRILEAA